MKTVVLKHKNWIIVNDGKFPSSNYCLFNVVKASRWNEKGDLPAHGVAYCGSLKNALTSLFQQMIVENCKDRDYKATMKNLSNAIQKAKQEFDSLLTPKILKELEHGKK